MSTAERIAISEALALPLCIWASFRILGVPRTQALLRSWASASGRPVAKPLAEACESQILSVRRAQRIVKRSTGIGGNCLVRSLTLWSMLLRRGVETDLRVGFRKRDGRIQGHAWIELDGMPLNEAPAEARTFAPYSEPVRFDVWLRRTGNQFE